MADRGPGLVSRGVMHALVAIEGLRPITVHGTAPKARKCILLGAPHTTNWDFLFFLAVTRKLGIQPRFMGKHSLFRWPMTRFMYDMGGFPVERSKRGNYVDQVVAQFAAHDEFRLVIAPEGTRGAVNGWKSGFYHIARAANVPVVPAWVDYSAGQGGIGPEMEMTGDFAGDLARIAAFYRSVMPDHPKLEALHRQVALLGGASGK